MRLCLTDDAERPKMRQHGGGGSLDLGMWYKEARLKLCRSGILYGWRMGLKRRV